MPESDFQFDDHQLSDMDNNIGLPGGKLKPYYKAPAGDRNHVMEEMGKQEMNQLAYKTKFGV